MAAPETAPPPHRSRDPRVHQAPADTAAACSAAPAGFPSGASWTSGSSPPPLAAARRAPPLERSTPRASRARVLHLLRPSCGPGESPGPARPFLAAYATGRSYALLHCGTASGSVPDFGHLPTPAQQCVNRTRLKRARSDIPLSTAEDEPRAAQRVHSKTRVVPRGTLSIHFDTRCALGRSRCALVRARSPRAQAEDTQFDARTARVGNRDASHYFFAGAIAGG